MVRCELGTGTRHFGKFGTSTPVPDTVVSSVRSPKIHRVPVYLTEHTHAKFEDLIDFVHPDLNQDARLLHDRTIVATTDASVDASHDAKRPGNTSNILQLLHPQEVTKSNPNTTFASPEHRNN